MIILLLSLLLSLSSFALSDQIHADAIAYDSRQPGGQKADVPFLISSHNLPDHLMSDPAVCREIVGGTDIDIYAAVLHSFPKAFSRRTSGPNGLDKVTEPNPRIYDVLGNELAVLMKASFGPGTDTPVSDSSYVPGLFLSSV